jgi:hypothetical protein
MITGVAGSAIYVSQADAWWILGLGNSRVFDSLIKLRLGSSEAGIIQVGHLQNSPLPCVSEDTRVILSNGARAGWLRQINRYMNLETSAYYLVPISGRVEEGNDDDILRDLDFAASASYGVSIHEFSTLAGAKDEAVQSGNLDESETPRSQISYAVGVVFGRWDIRYATGERSAPELPDPFAPLPVCPPGMLQGDDGLPLGKDEGKRMRDEGKYPLDVAWDGILVDDPEHPLDLERRVRAALEIMLWGDRASSLEHEACEILGVKSCASGSASPPASSPTT